WTAPGPSPTTPRSRSPRPRRSGTSAGSRGPAPRRDPARERQADAGRLVRGGRGVRPVVVAAPAGPRPGHGDRGSRLVEGPPAPDTGRGRGARLRAPVPELGRPGGRPAVPVPRAPRPSERQV